MPDGLAEWVWILTCRRCSRVVDFEEVCVPIQRLTEWATCCGQVMQLESVLPSPADG
jgi:hypothetical protein